MDDRFMHQMRRDPDPRFTRDLRERLRAQESPRRFAGLRLAPAFAGAVAAAFAVSLFVFPSVRVSAQALLDLFRVRNFAAVPFDAARIEKLRETGADAGLMVLERVGPAPERVPPVRYTSVDAASGAAGFQVRTPGYRPHGIAGDTLVVQPEGSDRLAVNERELQRLLDALELHDVTVPAGIDGKEIGVRVRPVVFQLFRSDRFRATVIQARSPELSVPAGLDVARCAEIGLRVLGLDPGEARRVAQSTDWRSTFVVPVPLNASTFRQVTVQGRPGLLVTTSAAPGSDGQRRRGDTTLLWTDDDLVFGVVGNLSGDEALQMAESLH